ncbi:MAG: LytTR family transcriptional regulator DNA-binding domain-containing protein [Lactobacillus porci]|nr:LytTR family transcriptional regulator DNA-binding domain-containing protein [Lactobacillus porci]
MKELPQKYPALVQVSESCVINPANVKEVDLKEKKLTFITGDVRYFSTRNSRKVRQLFQER